VPFPDYARLRPWDRLPEDGTGDWVGARDRGDLAGDQGEVSAALREQIRRLVMEELRDLVEVG
jgi:hypothetical protein